MPAGLDQFADRLGLGQQRDVASQRIPRAEDPAVVVVAAQNPLIGFDEPRITATTS
jgi:hypothetical protein